MEIYVDDPSYMSGLESGVNRDVAMDGRTVIEENYGAGGTPINQRPDYEMSGSYLSGVGVDG